MKLITLVFFYFVFISSSTAHCGSCSVGEKAKKAEAEATTTCRACKEGHHDEHSCKNHKDKKDCACCGKEEESKTKKNNVDGRKDAPSEKPSKSVEKTSPVPPETTPSVEKKK